MSGPVRHYLIRSAAPALLPAAVLTLVFLPRGAQGLLWALAGWAPMALIGVAGGAWTVARFGRVGPGFPLAVLTCILLRLFLGLGGLGLASLYSQVVPYLAGSLATFAVMQGFEMLWFLRRSRLQPADGTEADAIG